MRRERVTRRTIALTTLVIVLALGLLAAPGGPWLLRLDAAALQPEAGTVEVDAIQCWRRVGKNAVYVGEHFDMVLTCSVVDADAARTVPDLAWLEPETLTVSPFEVLEGQRYGDIVRGPRTFFQYRYTLQIIGEDYFGIDVELPALEIKYRIERALDGGSPVEGRELTYILPPESVRVLSLVPAAVADIRELPGDTFGDAEARLFRANVTVLVAAVLAIVALGTLVAAAVRTRREWRGAGPAVDKPVSHWQIARRALGELTAVQTASQTHGWNTELVGRALATFRLAGAVALPGPIAQQVVEPGVGDREGQLSLRRGLLSTKRTRVSSALTPEGIRQWVERVRTERPADAGVLDEIREALVLFGAARYRQVADLPTDALTTTLDTGITLLRRLQVRTAAPVRRAEQLWRSARRWVTRVWPS